MSVELIKYKKEKEIIRGELGFEKYKKMKVLGNEKETTHSVYWHGVFHIKFGAKKKRIRAKAYKLNCTVALKGME